MSNQLLFSSPQGDVTTKSLKNSLLQIEADSSDVLYIHSGLNFGQPNTQFSRTDLLSRILEVLLSLNVETICMPTYTFSFCNGENFHLRQSKSRMGALNEFFRSHPQAKRSLDPLMSVSIIGSNTELISNLGTESIGAGSTFQKLENSKNPRFLFLGVNLGDCFTHMHHLEWKAQVPYRYNREFTGFVDDGNHSRLVTQTLFVRFSGVTPNSNSYSYQKLLFERGALKTTNVGSGPISSISLSDAEPLYLELLYDDPNYFIESPFSRELVTTDFAVDKMVAL
jgi:aminoglycoside 3-N-acetyltransferase